MEAVTGSELRAIIASLSKKSTVMVKGVISLYKEVKKLKISEASEALWGTPVLSVSSRPD